MQGFFFQKVTTTGSGELGHGHIFSTYTILIIANNAKGINVHKWFYICAGIDSTS